MPSCGAGATNKKAAAVMLCAVYRSFGFSIPELWRGYEQLSGKKFAVQSVAMAELFAVEKLGLLQLRDRRLTRVPLDDMLSKRVPKFPAALLPGFALAKRWAAYVKGNSSSALSAKLRRLLRDPDEDLLQLTKSLYGPSFVRKWKDLFE
jgi:hypothetical protein